MNSAIVTGGGALLTVAAWLYHGPPLHSSLPDIGPKHAARPAATHAIERSLRSETERLGRVAAPTSRPQVSRNPFTFARPPQRTIAQHATAGPPASAAGAVMAEDSASRLILIGIASTDRDNHPAVAAIIAEKGDTLWIVEEQQMVGSDFRVTRIGDESADVTHIVTGSVRRLDFRGATAAAAVPR